MKPMVLKARLIVNTGSMFSGKTTELQRQGEVHNRLGHKVVFLKPSIDNRYSNNRIVSHDGQGVDAFVVEADQSIIHKQVIEADVVCIDEAQFFTEKLIKDINELLNMGKVVYVSGLDMDFKGRPFGIIPYLMAVANEVNKFNTLCVQCGLPAWVSARTTNSKKLVDVGEAEKYVPLCRECHKKGMN